MKRNLLFYLLLIPFFSLSQTWTNFTTINTTSEIQGNFCNIISGNGKTWVTSYKNKGLFYLENNIWSHFPQLDSFNVRILGLDNQKNPWFIKSDDHGHYILFKVIDNVIVEYGDYGSLNNNVTLGKKMMLGF